MVTRKHKVFISYYHKEDHSYANYLANNYGESIIDESLYDDLSDLKNDTILNKVRGKHLRDSTVTVVLVGMHTYGRKWVDWELMRP